DRMEVIRIAGYTDLEKHSIADRYLIPKQKEANGLKEIDIELSRKAVRLLIHRYTKEAGVRSLEREIASVCRKIAKDVLKSERDNKWKVTEKSISKLRGPPKYRYGTAE